MRQSLTQLKTHSEIMLWTLRVSEIIFYHENCHDHSFISSCNLGKMIGLQCQFGQLRKDWTLSNTVIFNGSLHPPCKFHYLSLVIMVSRQTSNFRCPVLCYVTMIEMFTWPLTTGYWHCVMTPLLVRSTHWHTHYGGVVTLNTSRPVQHCSSSCDDGRAQPKHYAGL